MPQSLCDHPGMISNAERALLFNLAKHYYTGTGLIIDAGVFLGASTVCFGEGIRQATENGEKSKPLIWSFEKGVVRKNFDRFVKRFKLPEHTIGESFGQTLKNLTSSYSDSIKLHLDDILKYKHPSNQSIEIAFLDILKTEKVCKHCIEQFYPNLNVGSYVIQQDYFFDQLPFVKYMQEAFSDCFSFEGQVNSSAVFKLVKKITSDDLSERLNSLTPQSALDFHSISEARCLDTDRSYFMKLSRAWLLADLGFLDEAKKYYNNVREEFFSQNDYSLERVELNFTHRHGLLEEYFKFMDSWNDSNCLQSEPSSWEAFIYKL
jgi:hypothetical protein